MELTLVLAHKIASLSLIIFLGFLLVRLRVLRFADSKPLSTYALYVLTPCAMLGAFQYPFSPEKLSGMGLSLLASVLAALVFALLSLAIARLFRPGVVELCSLAYPNVGNFMIPLVPAILGSEGLIYLSPCILLMNALMFTHGQAVLSGERRFRPSMVYKNVVLLSVLLGFAMFLTGWRLPGVLGETVETLGEMMGPTYMFTIGMILGAADLKRIFGGLRAYAVCFGRLLLYPAAAMLLLCFCGIFRLHPQAREIITVVVLASGAPAAVMVTQFSQMYRSEEDAQFSGAVNILSSLLCLVTMPLLAWLYQHLAY